MPSNKVQKIPEEKLRELLPQILKLVSYGLTVDEIADCLGIGRTTFYRYREKYSWLEETFQRGALECSVKVVDSLYKRAVGYEIEEVETQEYENKKGEINIRTRRSTKHFPPDVGAAIFWLKNRRKEDWKDRRENVTVPSSLVPEFKEIPDDELMDMISVLSKEAKSREKAENDGGGSDETVGDGNS